VEFFNKKEEVIELVLTKKGRELLSYGKFNPKYYSFHDNDIIYDNGSDEEQNSIIERIKEAPILKSATGLRQEGNVFTKFMGLNGKEHCLKCELGSKTNGDQYAPAWRIKFLKSPMFQYVGTDKAHIADGKKYEVSFVSGIDAETSNQELIPQINIQTLKDYNGNIEENLLVEISELNATNPDEFEEYEIEYYMVNDNAGLFDKLDSEEIKKFVGVYFDKLADLHNDIKTKNIYGKQVEVDESLC